MESLVSLVENRVRRAMVVVLHAGVASADPQIRPSDHADFQANGILALAKQLRVNPQEFVRSGSGGARHR